MYTIVLHTSWPHVTMEPTSFWDVVESWGNTWMWDNLRIMGDTGWIAEAIANNSLLTITNGSDMKDLYPYLNSAAFVFECTKGWGRLMGSFVKHTRDACSYHGELLDLMAIHLILLAVNKCNPDLPGYILIVSDCLGALNKMENRPPYCIPTKFRHSDILKNIMVHCSDLSFHRLYSHVKAHQDNNIQYGDLSQLTQLNCQMDYHAKKAIWEAGPVDEEITQQFRLKPVYVFLGKISSHQIRERH